MSNYSRRDVLRGAAVLGTAGVAGCLGGKKEKDSDLMEEDIAFDTPTKTYEPTPTPDETGDDRETDTATPTETGPVEPLYGLHKDEHIRDGYNLHMFDLDDCGTLSYTAEVMYGPEIELFLLPYEDISDFQSGDVTRDDAFLYSAIKDPVSQEVELDEGKYGLILDNSERGHVQREAEDLDHTAVARIDLDVLPYDQ